SNHIIECRSSVRMLLDGSKVAQSLFEAVLGTARESLSACMPEYVPRLLESADGLVDLCGPRGSRGRLSRLIALCWQSFAVLGADHILRVVLSAESRRPHPAHRQSPGPVS